MITVYSIDIITIILAQPAEEWNAMCQAEHREKVFRPHRNQPRFNRMLEMQMAACGANVLPAIVLKHLEYVPIFH